MQETNELTLRSAGLRRSALYPGVQSALAPVTSMYPQQAAVVGVPAGGQGQWPGQAHAHAHAHASFISTTTKQLPDSATNTDHDTLTLTAFTTTPICNLLHSGTDVGLPCPLPASLGTRARMAWKIAKFGPQIGDSCNCVGAAVRVCRCPWLQWLPRQVILLT
jgi:hypothetical protein